MGTPNNGIDTAAVVDDLNTILELELAGVVRYLHYSLMVFGHSRIPIVKWMRAVRLVGSTKQARTALRQPFGGRSRGSLGSCCCRFEARG